MHKIPHELSVIGSICGLFGEGCNGLGKHCLAYKPHTKESRQALKNAIDAKKRREESKE